MTASAPEVVADLFDGLAAGTGPADLAGYFAEDVDWYIAGDLDTVPWIGRKVGRAGVAEFFTQLRELTTSERFHVDAVLGDGDRCVVVGDLRTGVRSTGRTITSEFAIDVGVRDGLITRYHMLEDSWAASNAAADDGDHRPG